MASRLGTSRGRWLIVALGAALVAGCGGGSGDSGNGGNGGSGGAGGAGGGGPGGGGPGRIDVELAFEGRVGNEVFDCGKTFTAGSASTEVRITDFRLYVHDVRLLRTDGSDVPVELTQDGLWQHENLALLDFENKTGACANGTSETNGVIRGQVEDVTYTGIAFKVGVPFELNHGDASAAPSPLNLSALFWNWNGGYKFLRVDAAPTAAGGGAFNVHIGSTGCTEDAAGAVTACDRPNRPEVRLSGFDPLKSKIVIDYAALVADSDLSQNVDGAPGCMAGSDDTECKAIMGRLGIHVDDGSVHPDEQKLFTAE
ncbi:MbnP family copper-binding protein [Polyangium jinanense]|uniref:Metallo-mystery pair system four-Cys motif protein n=1 Tax=Polyangium jinanense TaxID=2829994 RepID=A0A9X3X2N9_9BACT|nr:MbnP family copper-binding protein [Polyangium jinanense]MDC3952702.1 metallo-mystery pair system four-Cys motif protein [Polyangium jinanense]MDC3980321.1 metallo-mystery pair system four-Cys motif protein [Polyangium jinanense]